MRGFRLEDLPGPGKNTPAASPGTPRAPQNAPQSNQGAPKVVLGPPWERSKGASTRPRAAHSLLFRSFSPFFSHFVRFGLDLDLILETSRSQQIAIYLRRSSNSKCSRLSLILCSTSCATSPHGGAGGRGEAFRLYIISSLFSSLFSLLSSLFSQACSTSRAGKDDSISLYEGFAPAAGPPMRRCRTGRGAQNQ